MLKKVDKNTRYYIDLDLKNQSILGWNFDDRFGIDQELSDPNHHRVFITKGQYQKLDNKRKKIQ